MATLNSSSRCPLAVAARPPPPHHRHRPPPLRRPAVRHHQRHHAPPPTFIARNRVVPIPNKNCKAFKIDVLKHMQVTNCVAKRCCCWYGSGVFCTMYEWNCRGFDKSKSGRDLESTIT